MITGRVQGMMAYFRRSLSFLGLMLIASGTNSTGNAQVPREVGFRVRCFAVVNARIIPEPGKQIDSGRLIIRDGVIVAVGPDVEIPADAEIVDAQGHTVTSAFFDAGSTVLFDPPTKPEFVPGRPLETNRYPLAGLPEDAHFGLSPQVTAAEHIKVDYSRFETFRQAGFGMVHVLPIGRVLPGQGAVITTSGLPVREALLTVRTGQVINLRDRGENRQYPSTEMGVFAHLRQKFLDADRLALQQKLFAKQVPEIPRPATDPILSEIHVWRHEKLPSIFVTPLDIDVERALRFSDEFQLRPWIWGASHAERRIEHLKSSKAEILLTLDFGEEPKVEPLLKKDDPSKDVLVEVKDPVRVQKYQLDEWKLRVAGLKRLEDAGLKFAIATKELKGPSDVFKSLRMAMQQGLSRDAALAALTTNPARILGLDKKLGTLAPGKLAHVVVMTGPFEHEKSKVRYLFLDGQKFEYNTDAKPVDASASDADREKSAIASLSGHWKVAIDSTEGPLNGHLEFTQTGTQISGGRFESDQGVGKLQQIIVETKPDAVTKTPATTIKFTVAIGAGDRELQLKFSGKQVGEKLEGTLNSRFGGATKWTASKEPSNSSDSKLPASGKPIPDKSAIAVSSQKDGPKTEAAKTNVDLPFVSAIQPENRVKKPNESTKNSANTPAVSTAETPKEYPTELWSDRTQRHLATGGNVLIRNVTLLPVTSASLPNHSLMVKNGKIVAMAPQLEPEAGMTVIDSPGWYVMPGIIDTHSHMMVEGGVNEGTHSITCEVRMEDVIITDDMGEYFWLASGMTTARILHGSSNTIGGQDVIIQLKIGGSVADHLMPNVPKGVKFALGENVKRIPDRFPNTRMGVEATLQRAFIEALEYRRQWRAFEKKKSDPFVDASKLLPPRRDLRLEALVEILEGQKLIHSHCYRSDEIQMLLRTADKFGLKIQSLQHVLEGYKLAPEIAAHGASCSTFADLWAYKVEAFDSIPQNPAMLFKAGVNVGIKTDFPVVPHFLNWEAGKSLRYGLTPDEALRMITLHPARELGIADRVGSLEVGKQADLAIFNEHPLNRFSRCEMTLIAGEVYFVRDKQPTAMSAEAAKRSKTPPPAQFLDPKDRRPNLEFPERSNGVFAFTNANLHPVDSAEIDQGTLLVKDGQIAAIGRDVPIPDEAVKFDLAGLHIYPGLIDAGSYVGMSEIGAVTVTVDRDETGPLQPDLKAATVVNPDSEHIPVARLGGITTSLVYPSGGIIGGQASLMHWDGWTAGEMTLVAEAGLHINWPDSRDMKDNRQKIESLKHFLKDARLYLAQRKAQGEQSLIDPRFEALRPYLEGSPEQPQKPVIILAHSDSEILSALRFAEQEKLKIILAGAQEAWKLTEAIKKANVPVIVGPVQRRAYQDWDPFDTSFANAGRMFDEGIPFCFRSESSAMSRNIPLDAGVAVAYGLPPDAAIRAMTLSAAEILGIADRTGSLTPGKRADLIITDGSPLQSGTQIKGILIHGKPVSLETKQTRLYEKYRKRSEK